MLIQKTTISIKDNIILRKGYALKVTTYNPGKTDMLEGMESIARKI